MLTWAIIKSVLGRGIKAVPPKVWLGLALVAGVGIYSAAVYWHGYSSAKKEWQAKAIAVQKAFNLYKGQIAEERKQVQKEQDARYTKQQQANRDAEAQLKHNREEADNAAKNLIADLHNGNLKLRKSLVQCQASSAGKSSTPAEGSDGTSEGRLSPEFEEFLVGEAQRADKVVGQLTACQAVAQGLHDSLLVAPSR